MELSWSSVVVGTWKLRVALLVEFAAAWHWIMAARLVLFSSHGQLLNNLEVMFQLILIKLDRAILSIAKKCSSYFIYSRSSCCWSSSAQMVLKMCISWHDWNVPVIRNHIHINITIYVPISHIEVRTSTNNIGSLLQILLLLNFLLWNEVIQIIFWKDN